MKVEVSPAFLLRAYAWAVLTANDPTTWNTDNYGGLTPIVPLAEEPELTQYDGPHIVYGYSLNPIRDLHARRGGSMAFVVYDQNFRRLTQTLTTLAEAFGRYDESARDINRFTAKNPAFIGMTFGYVSLAMFDGGSPEQTEGGRQSGIVNIRFEYHVDYDTVTNV